MQAAYFEHWSQYPEVASALDFIRAKTPERIAELERNNCLVAWNSIAHHTQSRHYPGCKLGKA